MKLNDYLKTFAGSQTEVRLARMIHAALATAVVLLALQSFMRDTAVILTPPGLSSEVKVSRTEASPDYMEAWGLHLANILGNVHPGNADFIKGSVGPLLSTKIFQNVMEVIQTQVEDIKRDRVTQRFEPRAVQYEPDTGKTYVDGYSVVTGPSGGHDRHVRTYEFKFKITNYRLTVEQITTYQGQPKTMDVITRQKQVEERNNG